MKLRYLLVLSLLSAAFIGINSIEAKARCYCSDLCGPRDQKSSDKPFIDEATGICFCAPRDKKNYVPNGCSRKPKPAKSELTSCGQ